MLVSNLTVGNVTNSTGTLTVNSGTVTLRGSMSIGAQTDAKGTVWLKAGRLPS